MQSTGSAPHGRVVPVPLQDVLPVVFHYSWKPLDNGLQTELGENRHAGDRTQENLQDLLKDKTENHHKRGICKMQVISKMVGQVGPYLSCTFFTSSETAASLSTATETNCKPAVASISRLRAEVEVKISIDFRKPRQNTLTSEQF